MLPQVIKYRLWAMALRMNPQQGTLNVRTAASTVGNADSFTSYNLLRLVYKPPTLEQLRFVSVDLGTQYGVWTILTVDLSQANAAPPALNWELVINGQTWIIEKIDLTAM